jgi:hypothetical protein
LSLHTDLERRGQRMLTSRAQARQVHANTD